LRISFWPVGFAPATRRNRRSTCPDLRLGCGLDVLSLHLALFRIKSASFMPQIGAPQTKGCGADAM
jgi:hypothetical protein